MVSITNVKITVLVDDFNGVAPGYVKDFGFAALIEKEDNKILFDTGTNSEVLSHNLNNYGLSPKSLDAIILSHNHYDHTNGINSILSKNEDIPIYVHKFWSKPVRFRGTNLPEFNLMVNDKARECKELTNGIFLTNTHSSGDYGGIYEHACYVQIDSSYILICGCCHPGLKKFLSDRSDLEIPYDASLHFIGGMHSFRFDDKEAKELNHYVRSIKLCHCTQNYETFFRQFPNRCQKAILGKTIPYTKN